MSFCHARRWMGRLVVVVAAALLIPLSTSAPVAADQDVRPPLDAGQVRHLEKALQDVAKRGRAAETRELLAWYELAESDEKKRERSVAKAKTALGKAKRVEPKAPAALRELGKLQKAVAALLAPTPPEGVEPPTDEQRLVLADLMLALDPDDETARKLLGHQRFDDEWVPAAVVPMLERRRAVQTKAMEARRLPVPVVHGKSDLAVVKALYPEGGISVTHGDWSVHSGDVSAAKLERILTTALRALAFSSWLCGKEFEVPRWHGGKQFVLVSQAETFQRAIDEAGANGGLVPKKYKWIKEGGFSGYFDDRGWDISEFRAEAHAQGWLLHYGFHWTDSWAGGKQQPTLFVGHLNWVHLEFLGVPLDDIAWIETEEERKRRGTAGSVVEQVERTEMLKLAEAGLEGTRAWVRYLAERGEDPAWSQSFLDEIGKIGGDVKLKATLVTQFLQEQGRLGDVMAAAGGKAPTSDVMSAAVGTDLAAFEESWREWILAGGRRVGLIERLGSAAQDEGPSPQEVAILEHLTEIRTGMTPEEMAELVSPLAMFDDLSEGCARHVAYLHKHPAQLEAWPDAHEQYPDKEGFSAKGCRSGLHSVIYPGVEDGIDAIDGWMATFYHRIPLLVPGLMRIGYAFDDGLAVLDCASIVGHSHEDVYVMWPKPDQKAVPLRFAPELPNPVPGEDQSEWGYPVTLQLFGYSPEPEVDLRLVRGKDVDGPEVDCHLSTPSNPTNPQLAPKGAFCLIPKAHLSPNTTYTVVVTGMPGQPKLTWRFTTGK